MPSRKTTATRGRPPPRSHVRPSQLPPRQACVAGRELWIPDLFIGSCLQENCPVHLRGVWSGLTVPTNRAPQCYVNGQLRAPEAWQVLCQHFDFRSSVARTPTFMSRRRALNFTRAPASRHMRANVLSTGVPLLEASRVRASCSVPSQRVERFMTRFANRLCQHRRSLSRSNTRKKCGGMVNSRAVGACASANPALQPECDRR